jgi:hypothetical protein
MTVARADTGIAVVVVASDSACADCLAPREVFEGILFDTLVRVGLPVEQDDLELTYPRADR